MALECDPTNLDTPSQDTYCLAKQWLHAHTLRRHQRPGMFDNMVELGERTIWEGDEQIPQLVGQIISFGTAYYPVDAYPHFTTHEISTAYTLWQRHKEDLGLNEDFGAALQAAHDNHFKDPR